MPTTRSGLDALIMRREQVREQIAQLTVRRRELLEQSVQLPEASRGDHNARIAAIDQRSADLEREQYLIEDLIGQAQVGRIEGGGQSRSGSLLQDQTTRDVRGAVENASREAVFSSIFGILAMYLVYRGFRRFIWRRKPAPALPDYGPQIAQLQQSIDVIALEVERISEGQRYVAKVLGDRGALGPGAAEPVSVAQREGVAHRRG